MHKLRRAQSPRNIFLFIQRSKKVIGVSLLNGQSQSNQDH